jgi:hypothetical protein
MLQSIVLSQLRQGTWKITGNTLCLTLKARRDQSTECYEVWLWKDHVEYRQNGVTVTEICAQGVALPARRMRS